MKRLAVFCGSSPGASKIYTEEAIRFGKVLARRNITLVYGGSRVGIMGAVADAVLNDGGKVIGVIPKFLEEKEISHPGLTVLHTVETMHERKAKMAEFADGFVALPGGTGTLEEFFEVLHGHKLACIKSHVAFSILMATILLQNLFEHMVDQQFVQDKFRSMVILESGAGELLDRFIQYIPPAVKSF